MARYIDADKLKADIKEIAGKQDGKLTEFEVLGIMSGQPTADVRENVRGEWVEKNDVYRCSVCGKEALWSERIGSVRTDFCPNCGADMRGEAND